MIKRIQNKVAESRYALPVMVAYGTAIWLLSGLTVQGWWVQFACFLLSTFLMVELNNSNALIRIYSRSVSVAFIVLSGVACFTFPSMSGAIVELCFIASLLTLFRTYQDRQSPGWTFYTYLIIGIATLVDIHALWIVLLYWILQTGFLFSISTRNFCASLLGLALPYSILATWTLWTYEDDFYPFLNHFVPLTDIGPLSNWSLMTLPQLLTLAFVLALAITGTIHYLRTSFHDKIRIRQIYYSLIFLTVAAVILLIIQPQHYDFVIRLIIVTTSPLIGHFLALTYTRITNVAFFVIAGTALVLTIINLWSSSLIF